MNAERITAAILRERWRKLRLPRYTPKGWWECDVFELTTSGYFREYEIKTSLSDFRNDAKKFKSGWAMIDGHWTEAPKKEKARVNRRSRWPFPLLVCCARGIDPVGGDPGVGGLDRMP